MQTGRIIKLLGGFYTVKSGNEIFETRARGNFRKKDVKPLVGDFVKFDKAYILEMLDRKNSLLRPAVANIDQVLVVMSTVEPDFNRNLLDRFLVLLEHRQISAEIYLTKTDLAQLDLSDYENIGYKVLTSPEAVLSDLTGKVTVFMGQTGVGKSTLLNKIAPELDLATAEISTALGRGRHTTRHVELYEVAGGLIADTPGFSSLDYEVDTIPELNRCFIEIYHTSADCKFRECTHTHEPECAVKVAVEKGEIVKSRYASFLQLSSEINKTREIYIKRRARLN